jgi:hypothetical protein
MRSTLLILAAMGFAASGAAQDLSETNFDRLAVLIKPTAEESLWSEIPWLLDLNEARKKAVAAGKPLFVWSMSGEPLGQC